LLVLVALVCLAEAQLPFTAILTGDKQVPPVTTSRTAAVTVFAVVNSGSPTYKIETTITDITSFALYGPAGPGQVGPLLGEVKNPPLQGSIQVSTQSGNQNPLFDYLSSSQVYAIIRTAAFPDGEIRGNFEFSGFKPLLLGAAIFPVFSDAPNVPRVECAGGSECSWSTGLPLGGASVAIRGPDGFQLTLLPRFPNVNVPGYTEGTFTLPTIDFAKFFDYGVRGELRMVYLTGSVELTSTALSVAERKPTFRAILDGSNIVPSVTTNADGEAKITSQNGVATVKVTHDVANGTKASLNTGEPGTVILDLQPGATYLTESFKTISVLLPLDPAFSSGNPNWFVKISSKNFPSGEIGGKVEINPLEVFSATLSPQNVVPPVSSTAFGNAEVQYDDAWNRLFFYVNATINGAQTVVLRGPAEVGSTGPELAILCSYRCDLRALFIGALDEGSSGFVNGQTLDSTLDVLRSGKAYVEIRTAQNPQGELRANLPTAQIVSTQSSLFLRFPIDKTSPAPPTAPISLPRLFRRKPKQAKN